MKKLAIFDMDGTLFNTNDVNYYAYNEALKEKGYSINYETYCNDYNGRHYTTFLPQIVSNEKDVEDIHNRKKELYTNFLDKAKVNSHLFNIIKHIKKEYYIALVTTASEKNTYDILTHFNKHEIFDLILTANDIKKPKPDPEGFNKAITHFGTKISEVIIFEDSKVGVEAAEKTGANVCVVKRF